MAAAGGGLGDDPELAALRDALAAVGATAPRLVYRKELHKFDLDANQRRLLIPCKGADDGDASALTAFLTADEVDRVHEAYGFPYPKAKLDDRWSFFYRPRGQGIVVPVYDRHGRRFDMGLKKIESNRGYRFFGAEWMRFVRTNQLQEAMAAVAEEEGRKRKLEAEVWAFRSAELRPEFQAEGGGGDQHPDGVLGVAILVKTSERSLRLRGRRSARVPTRRKWGQPSPLNSFLLA
ncbi:hypothetical protein HU200_008271 [Digitaria exilis]|uniref:Uncharacterized protein n=1 Tax=Digitaria exilis TaxID=1010633 RepID=A0A835FLW9_9POAL|nr:hypothetical protein HU200_008271 [Digitaria exilis]